jgi:glycosyltransferase involved in cell wall biosynthesis
MTERPLRILTVANVPADPNSGAAGTVFHTNTALRELGHQVEEIWRPDLGAPLVSHGNLHSWLEQPRRYACAVSRACAAARFDVVMISQPQAWLAFQRLRRDGYGGALVNRSHGVELLADQAVTHWAGRLGARLARFPQSLLTPWLNGRLRAQWPLVLRAADAVVVPSRADLDFLGGRFPAEAGKVLCNHHGVGSEFLAPAPPLDAGRLQRVLYVGQHSFIKGYHCLLDILRILLPRQPGIRVTWVTQGSAHAGLRSSLPPELASRVDWRGWVPHSELPRLLDDHGIFVFPSYYEGAGKAALEAMARGLFLVSSDTGAMRDYVRDSGNGGALCPPGDPAAFAEAVLRAIAEPEVTFATAGRGRSYAAAKSWIACASGLVGLFHRLQDGPAGRSRHGGK